MFCCGMREKLYQSRRVMRAATVAAHRPAIAKVAGTPKYSHCSEES